VEIETGNTRILLDFGMPLKDPSGADFTERDIEGMPLEKLIEMKYLFDIKGLYKSSIPSIDGIFISHSHKDHYGFLSHVNPEIHVYLSKGVYGLIHALNIFLPASKRTCIYKPIFLRNWEKISMGELSVTPYLVDHSGFNAMGFLITEESTGKTILYSGDFRVGGWTKKRYEAFLKKPLKDVDCLLMEGTMVGRENGKYPDEESVVRGIMEAVKKCRNKVIPVYCSGQNIDRIVSLYKAARKTGSLLVVDPYTACMLKVAGEITGSTPEIEWDSIRVFVANYGKGDIYVNKIARSSRKEMLISIGRKKIKTFNFAEQTKKALLLMRNTMIPVVERIPEIKGSILIYSQWKGYVEKDTPDARRFREFVRRHDLTIEHIHTSGHATIEQLKKFAEKVNARHIVPIHTEHPDEFKKHFGDKVVHYKDGQVLSL
jgi:ribonuclease J